MTITILYLALSVGGIPESSTYAVPSPGRAALRANSLQTRLAGSPLGNLSRAGAKPVDGLPKLWGHGPKLEISRYKTRGRALTAFGFMSILATVGLGVATVFSALSYGFCEEDCGRSKSRYGALAGGAAATTILIPVFFTYGALNLKRAHRLEQSLSH